MAAPGPGPVPLSTSDPNRGYVAPPSTAHELGVMFGFIGVMIVASVLYGLGWQWANKRDARREAERIENLQFAEQQARWREEEKAYAEKNANAKRKGKKDVDPGAMGGVLNDGVERVEFRDML